MQKYLKNTGVAFIAALGTSVAIADSSSAPMRIGAEATSRNHVVHAAAGFQNEAVVNGWRRVEGEAVWVLDMKTPAGPQGKTRAQVHQELIAFRTDPEALRRHASFYQWP
ncbi:hypothetical protein [Aromatoleum aromaticum]|uniref:hypothetical protein n=1 Tax=Aromatoleum aromaticum TaxID=551760 RepID=UPI001459B0F2|nr:hypothetical protein [Aromatoleum aromaticum]NMG54193.1 hypothetical protein [Aromatoleum aromaticum]